MVLRTDVYEDAWICMYSGQVGRLKAPVSATGDGKVEILKCAYNRNQPVDGLKYIAIEPYVDHVQHFTRCYDIQIDHAYAWARDFLAY